MKDNDKMNKIYTVEEEEETVAIYSQITYQSVLSKETRTHACVNLIWCKFKSLKFIPECLIWCCGFHIRFQIEPIMRPFIYEALSKYVFSGFFGSFRCLV